MKIAALPPVAAAIVLAGCATTDSRPEVIGEPIAAEVTSNAAVVPASYGVSASFRGDRILRYPDFDVVFMGTELGNGIGLPQHDLRFELRDRDGRKLDEFGWSPVSGDAGSLVLAGKEFHYGVEVAAREIEFYLPEPGNRLHHSESPTP